MAREDYTEIAVIMDESGSMDSTKDDAIGGFNSFIASQKEVGGIANLTLVLFDNKYEVRCDGLPICDVVDLDRDTYCPGGSTALIDAIGKTVDTLSARIVEMDDEEKPGKVIIVVITDGQENSSCEYTRASVAKKIKEYTEREKWEIVFIGASAEILEQAEDLGIHEDRMMCYSASAVGTRGMYAGMSDAVSSYRLSGSLEVPDKAPEDDGGC